MYKNKRVRVLSEEEITEIKSGPRNNDLCFCLINENGRLDFFEDLRTITDCENMIEGDFWDFYESEDDYESTWADYKICTPISYSI